MMGLNASHVILDAMGVQVQAILIALNAVLIILCFKEFVQTLVLTIITKHTKIVNHVMSLVIIAMDH